MLNLRSITLIRHYFYKFKNEWIEIKLYRLTIYIYIYGHVQIQKAYCKKAYNACFYILISLN